MPAFPELFGHPPSAAADAPGRVNLIGEHTDYNGGFVLPLAIPQRTRVELSPRPDRRVRAWSAGFADAEPGTAPAGSGTASPACAAARETAASAGVSEYTLGGEAAGRGWLDYVQGVTWTLGGAGFALTGFDLRIESAVPPGAGLSSSAALAVALMRGLRAAFGLPLDDLRIARLAQLSENQFVGAPVGIMDPMACSLAGQQHALFLDTRSLEFERLPLPPAAELAVIDSGISHGHAGGEYRVRRAECEAAARQLGVEQLRDLGLADLPRLAALPPPLDRRARHVVTENARVLAAVEALRAGAAPRLGELLRQGHRSLSRDFEVSLPEIDLLVELAGGDPAVLGARLTGGGFGGAVVVLARRGEALPAARRLVAAYDRSTGRSGAVLVPPSRNAAAPRAD